MTILERNDTNNVAYLHMNMPNKLNALSDEMLAELQTNLESIGQDEAIRAVVISGEGKAFCAGHDLKQMTQGRQAEDGGQAYFKDLFERCSKMMLTVQSIPKPVIAQVHGIATAAGCQLVATCDMAVAAEGTKFGVNGVNIGLFCSTPMVALSRNIPRKKAFEMLTTGQFIDTQAALDMGLVNKVVPQDALAEETKALAELVASKLSAAVKVGKEAFYKQIQMSPADAYAYAGDVMVQNMLYRDTEEGIAAFLEKRSPNWGQ